MELLLQPGEWGLQSGQRTSPVDYHSDYFLINGNPYTPALAPIPAGTPGQRVLLRFLNASLAEKTPILQNQSMSIIAEDGNLLPHFKSAVFYTPSRGKNVGRDRYTRCSQLYPRLRQAR